MIPLHLTLRNFLSYRETAELDLAGIHLACISGLNGAGKSTILDGMTWALFGKSRVKSDDDIVNRHAAANGLSAEVTFVFELEGTIYRVIRRKSAGKTTELELNARVPNADGDHWQVKTEARIRDTQAEIEKLLRMNYEVFTNASFLLQGKADEFTTKTPDRRKEILAEILGVSLWDDYKDLATDRRKETDGELAAVDRQIAEVEAELSREEEFVQALEIAESRAQAVTAERDRQDTLVAVARQNKSLADQQRNTLKRIAAELVELEGELERIEVMAAARRDELSGHHALMDRREAIEAAFADWQKIGADITVWQAKSEQYNQITREMHPLELAIARAETQLQHRISELEIQKSRAETQAVELKTLQSNLTADKKELENILARAAELSDQESAWQLAQTRLQQLEYERKLWEQEFDQLQSNARQIASWQVEREQIEASRQADSISLEEAERALKDLAEQQVKLAAGNTERATLEAEKGHLKAEMDKLKADMVRLESVDGGDCPTCGQPLTADHRDHFLQESEKRGKGLAAQYHEKTATIDTLTSEIKSLEGALQQQRIWENKFRSHQAAVTRHETQLQTIDNNLAAWRDGNESDRLAELEKVLADGREQEELSARIIDFKAAADEVKQLNQEQKKVEGRIVRDQTRSEELERVVREWKESGQQALEVARRQLAEGAFAEVERDALAVNQTRLLAIDYDPAGHAAARTKLAELSAAPQEHQRLLQAEAAVKPLADGLVELDRQRERANTRAADLRIQHEQSVQQLQALESGVGDLHAAELELQRLREEVVLANRASGAARQRVEVLAIRREDRKQLAAKKTGLARRIGLLRQLEEACGRKGVQALLIEAALPEIQDYANELLFRLTSGDMQVSFDTHRASKTKQDNVIETLDIKISDSAGERPYENYSGGEKFRVNFAIRLALSQVLARRAGARLRTLVIDEGFGSQDPEGRQRLVEAINAVQDNFACILVITHIDELRDKFPARIDVEKTTAGSRLSVVTV